MTIPEKSEITLENTIWKIKPAFKESSECNNDEVQAFSA